MLYKTRQSEDYRSGVYIMPVSDLFLIMPAVLTAFVICYVSIPVIIRIAGLKQLIDEPDASRKFHAQMMPTLGGIGIFAAFIVSFSVWGQAGALTSYPFFIAALFILFLVGVKDDIVVMEPVMKLFVQVGAALLLVVGGGVVITDFNGVLGLYEIPWVFGVMLSVLIVVAIVNSFNLIDGIDGLAGGIGVIASSIFGIWFWSAGFLSLAIMSFSLSAALIGFLAYNMHPAKIFMGDTGAMAVGFILGFLSLQFLALNIGLEGQAWHIPNAHVFAVAVLIIPITDTLRVIFLRFLKGKSPFTADRNHIHHKLTDTGINDLYVSFFLWLANIIVIGIAYSVMHLEINVQLAIILLLGVSILPAIRFIYITSHRLFLADQKNRKGESGNAAYDVN